MNRGVHQPGGEIEEEGLVLALPKKRHGILAGLVERKTVFIQTIGILRVAGGKVSQAVGHTALNTAAMAGIIKTLILRLRIAVMPHEGDVRILAPILDELALLVVEPGVVEVNAPWFLGAPTSARARASGCGQAEARTGRLHPGSSRHAAGGFDSPCDIRAAQRSIRTSDLLER